MERDRKAHQHGGASAVTEMTLISLPSMPQPKVALKTVTSPTSMRSTHWS